ncbi:cobalamin biosynthesis protein CobW [Curtobacterium sp. MCBD17_019]|nr:cobalamin biosynthesis protein CobW [Curtobacterium sp. MCBD17_019]
MTNVRPRRRTTCAPGSCFSDLSEFLTFMILLLRTFLTRVGAMEPRNELGSAHPDGGVLRVTLVSGLRAADRRQVSRRLSGAPRRAPVEVDDGTEDSGEFALVLADRILESARAGATGRSIVELEEAADVMEIGFVLETEFESRRAEGTPVELHDLMTVVAVRDIERWLLSLAPSPLDDYVTAERLASQIEFATVIVLSDADDIGPASLRSALGVLEQLNPGAAVVRSPSAMSSRRTGASGRWCARRLGERMGWMHALADPATQPGPRYGVEAIVFRDPRPFHPRRLFDAVDKQLTPGRVGRIARSRGLVQLATRADQIGSWRSAGDTVALDPTGMSTWARNAPAGQELVLFGEDLDRHRIISTLDRSLVTDAELLAGPMEWATYDDPFPAWPTEHHH